MKKLEVIAEFVDTETGERVFPAAAGEEPVTFTPHNEDQAERLTAAGCLREPKAKAERREADAKPEAKEEAKPAKGDAKPEAKA